MIGVVAPDPIRPVVEEFFQLFKTPWQFAAHTGTYDVLLCAGIENPGIRARLVILYGDGELPGDAAMGAKARTKGKGGPVRDGEALIPLYGNRVTFAGPAHRDLVEDGSRETLGCLHEVNSVPVLRLGFDLFREVKLLLAEGQPPDQAPIPALDLHIALLRDLILGFGIPLVEVPPVPQGHAFIVCLTHDVDHPVFRNHLADHTMLGFLMRSTVGSIVDFLQRRISAATVWRRWLAVARCPLVHLGWLADPWRESLMAYADLERGLGSTFFVIPFGGRTGANAAGGHSPKRASGYELEEIRPELEQLAASGCEIGVHGIDAWRDEAAGRQEREQITRVTTSREIGVRMHWLYFGAQSPAALDSAGFSYDSTVGYNQTIGFRAGTAQVFRPLGATALLELPLHVMDTALFYPSYLHLTAAQAHERVLQLTGHLAHSGGVLTLNWHDRSIGPERFWKGSYLSLISELKARGAWFPTAGKAVAWFRQRRSVSFDSVQWEPGCVRVQTSSSILETETVPGLRLRVHRPGGLDASGQRGRPSFVDAVLSRGEMAISA